MQFAVPDERASLRTNVIQALRVVIDPEIGSNVVDLGLIYSVEIVDDGLARVTMTTTIKGCPAAAFLKDAVANCARSVVGVKDVQVCLTYEPPWTADWMEPDRNPLFACERPVGFTATE